MTRGNRAALFALALLPAGAARAHAQCPDGTPPPCRGSTSAAAARRPNPPLDANTWIVLPFENVARAQDIDWLQAASVNLLYLDMSKWRDIRVIDDERVADLIREVPEARAGLTLQSGLAVARRAGAGKLVMGDLLKVGNNTQIVAKIYDVRSGNRVRNVREQTSNADSLMSLFGRLARGILNADAPTGSSLGIGTTRLEAYQAYVAGVTALNHVDLDSAAARFQRAIALDSSFALAHYKASVVYGWSNPNDRRRLAHAERAYQLATGLPPRERQLIMGQYQTSRGRWGEACQTYAAVLLADSSDVEAWYNLGECNFHDQLVAFADGDSSRPRFRSSWNTAMHAFQRALELDPTYHLAYAHIDDILLVDNRIGCLGRDQMQGCPPLEQYVASLHLGGDSLLTVPVRALATQEVTRQAIEAVRQGVSRVNLQRSRALAEAWVNAGPGEARAHRALGRALMRSGQPVEAAREFALSRGTGQGAIDARTLLDRFELLFKLDSMAAVGRLADSLAARPGRVANDNGNFGAVMVGRWQNIDVVFGPNFQGPAQAKRFLLASLKVQQGAVPDDLVAIELGLDSVFATAPEAARRPNRTAFLLATVPWTPSLDRPAALRDVDTASVASYLHGFVHLLRRDTSAARRSLAELEAMILDTPREAPAMTGFLLAGQLHLALGDSASALARLREFERRLPFANPMSTYLTQFGNLTASMQSWGRTFLQLADLAAAANDAPTAVRNYQRVVGLWSGADAAFQPHVRRAREALTRLGS